MRILVADNHEDGLYKCRGELIDELLKIAEVFISVPGGKYIQRLVEKGCVFEELKIARRGMNPFQESMLLISYAKLLKKIKPDIVLTYSVKPNVYLGYLCGRKKIPYIANVTGLGSSIQDNGFAARLVLFLYKIGLKKASMVFCQNKANHDFLLQHSIIRGPSKLIHGSGVNLEAHCFEDYPPETREIRFLTIGRIMKDKGIDELLEASRIVKSRYPDASFSLIGFYDGNYKEKIERAEKEGLVKFYGHQDDVHFFIKNCHAVIHPSYHEGMANALLESASSGRPVIATDVPGCIEAFDPGISGISCKPKDSKDLAQAIITFIDLPYSEKIKMGIAGRKKMEMEFDRRIIISLYMKEINEIEKRALTT